MAPVVINGERLGRTMTADRLGEDARGCLLVALIREGAINRPAARIHSAIESALLLCDLHGRFVHPPADRHREVAAAKHCFE